MEETKEPFIRNINEFNKLMRLHKVDAIKEYNSRPMGCDILLQGSDTEKAYNDLVRSFNGECPIHHIVVAPVGVINGKMVHASAEFYMECCGISVYVNPKLDRDPPIKIHHSGMLSDIMPENDTQAYKESISRRSGTRKMRGRHMKQNLPSKDIKVTVNGKPTKTIKGGD